jgi:hypothetical protein
MIRRPWPTDETDANPLERTKDEESGRVEEAARYVTNLNAGRMTDQAIGHEEDV